MIEVVGDMRIINYEFWLLNINLRLDFIYLEDIGDIDVVRFVEWGMYLLINVLGFKDNVWCLFFVWWLMIMLCVLVLCMMVCCLCLLSCWLYMMLSV